MKLNLFTLSPVFLFPSLFPELLDLNQGKEWLLYRGKKNRRGGEEIQEDVDVSLSLRSPSKRCFVLLLLYGSLYWVCPHLSTYRTSSSSNNGCVLSSGEPHSSRGQVLKLDNRCK